MRNLSSRIPDIKSLFTCRGDDVVDNLVPGIDRRGLPTVKKQGTRNLKVEINSHASECDMSVIVARLNGGDTSVLHVTEGMYGDFTGLPDSPAAALQMVMDGQAQFEKLPADIRARFGNDFNRWFCTAGSDSWRDSMGFTPKVDSTVSEEIEVVSVEKDVKK